MFYVNPNTNFTRGKNLLFNEKIEILKNEIETADAIVLGAGSGLSTAAGYVYSGERFKKYFSDFEAKYGFNDMYSGGFYPYETLEEFWGFWCRYIWINRYAPIPSDLYRKLFSLVRDKDYFVLTTNVDHCFQRAGFDKSRLFYTQGDYGLFQSSKPSGKSEKKTYDNFEIIKKMVLAEGFKIDENNNLVTPTVDCQLKPDNDKIYKPNSDKQNCHAERLLSLSKYDSASVQKEIPNQVRDDEKGRCWNDERKQVRKIKMSVPSTLLPVCPDDGKPMTTNLRSDDLFVEDEGWYKAAQNYEKFLATHETSHVLFLELGVGMNTPIIIKYPFWKFTQENKNAFYACVNKGEAFCPEAILKRSVCIDSGIAEVLDNLLS